MSKDERVPLHECRGAPQRCRALDEALDIKAAVERHAIELMRPAIAEMLRDLPLVLLPQRVSRGMRELEPFDFGWQPEWLVVIDDGDD